MSRLPPELGEWRAAFEPARLAAHAPTLARRRTRNPRTLIALPGLGASDLSTQPLRRYLNYIGHDALPWRLGRHGPDVPRTLQEFIPLAESAVERAGGPLALVGWSLGGIVSRETARNRPDLVDLVVTFGTPLLGPRHTALATQYTADQLDRADELVKLRRSAPPIRCPVVAIYSKNDGIAHWQGCIDDQTPDVRHVEVRSTHLGLGVDPDVWKVVADALEGR